MNFLLNDKLFNNNIYNNNNQINKMKNEFIISHERKFNPFQLIKYYNNYNIDEFNDDKYNKIIQDINKHINYILSISNGDILIFTNGSIICYGNEFSKKNQIDLDIQRVVSTFELKKNNFYFNCI